MRDADSFRIEAATERDVPLIFHLIKELAAYEKLPHEVTATEPDIRRALFGPKPAAEVLLGYAGSDAVGMALFFQNFSTFLGRPGLYLEDLFVLPEWRGRGLGQQLLRRLAQIAVERGYGRMEWSVLNWNEPAQRVYRNIGARPLDEWTVYRLTDEALQRLAGS
jgi:GNAT superfamily N-acetyltransferase